MADATDTSTTPPPSTIDGQTAFAQLQASGKIPSTATYKSFTDGKVSYTMPAPINGYTLTGYDDYGAPVYSGSANQVTIVPVINGFTLTGYDDNGAPIYSGSAPHALTGKEQFEQLQQSGEIPSTATYDDSKVTFGSVSYTMPTPINGYTLIGYDENGAPIYSGTADQVTFDNAPLESAKASGAITESGNLDLAWFAAHGWTPAQINSTFNPTDSSGNPAPITQTQLNQAGAYLGKSTAKTDTVDTAETDTGVKLAPSLFSQITSNVNPSKFIGAALPALVTAEGALAPEAPVDWPALVAIGALIGGGILYQNRGNISNAVTALRNRINNRDSVDTQVSQGAISNYIAKNGVYPNVQNVVLQNTATGENIPLTVAINNSVPLENYNSVVLVNDVGTAYSVPFDIPNTDVAPAPAMASISTGIDTGIPSTTDTKEFTYVDEPPKTQATFPGVPLEQPPQESFPSTPIEQNPLPSFPGTLLEPEPLPGTSVMQEPLFPNGFVNWRVPVVELANGLVVPKELTPSERYIYGQRTALDSVLMAEVQEMVKEKVLPEEFGQDVTQDEMLFGRVNDYLIGKDIEKLYASYVADAQKLSRIKFLVQSFLENYKELSSIQERTGMRVATGNATMPQASISEPVSPNAVSAQQLMTNALVSPAIQPVDVTQPVISTTTASQIGTQPLLSTQSLTGVQSMSQVGEQSQTETQTQTGTQTDTQTQTQTQTRTAEQEQELEQERTQTLDQTDTGTAELPIIPKDKNKSREEWEKEFQGAVGWKQGVGWWMLKAPYKSRDDAHFFYGAEPPAGMEGVEGGAKSAYKSIQAKGGDVPEDIFIDLGIQDIHIHKPDSTPGGEGTIEYKENYEKAFVGHRATDKKKARTFSEVEQAAPVRKSIEQPMPQAYNEDMTRYYLGRPLDDGVIGSV